MGAVLPAPYMLFLPSGTLFLLHFTGQLFPALQILTEISLPQEAYLTSSHRILYFSLLVFYHVESC